MTWALVIAAAPASLAFGLGVAGLAALLGWLIGSVAGFVGPRARGGIHAAADVLLGLPRLVLILCLVAAYRDLFSHNLLALGLVLGGTGWMGLARVVEAQARVVTGRAFVEAAIGVGRPRFEVLVRHVLPHTWAPVLAQLPLGLATALNVQAGLVAIGAIEPGPGTWGGLLKKAQEPLALGQAEGLLPAVPLIAVSVLAQLLSDRLRRHLDPATEIA